MDVVYNHISEYETGNLKEIDKDYYFRLDENGKFIAHSGTGNDLKTERPMMRRMIVESILYWMQVNIELTIIANSIFCVREDTDIKLHHYDSCGDPQRREACSEEEEASFFIPSYIRIKSVPISLNW